MRYLFLLLFILSKQGYAQTYPKTINVFLEKKRLGYYPTFRHTGIATPEQASLYTVPTGYKQSTVLRQTLQETISYYRAFKTGNISSITYKSFLNNLGIDTLTKPCTMQPFRHTVGIWVGFKGHEKYIRVDTNNDFSFLDEHNMVYDTLLDRTQKRFEDLPSWEIQYEYFNGKEVIPRTTFLKISPFSSNYKAHILDVDTAIEDNLAGSFRFEGAYYHIKLQNHSAGVDDVFPNSHFLLTSGEQTIEAKIGELFLFKDKYWKVQVGDGKTIDVCCLGNESEVHLEGVHKYHTLPLYTCQTIDNQEIKTINSQKIYTILYFWSTQNTKFKAQVEVLKAFSTKYPFVDFVGFVYDINVENVRDFVAQHELKHPQVFESMEVETDMAWRSIFEIRRYPTYLLINEKGQILERFEGGGALNAMEGILLKYEK